MTPTPWDWTDARARLATMDAVKVHALDGAVADLRGHVLAAGLQPTPEVAEALWLGARLTIGLLAPLLAYVGDDALARAHVQAHIDQVEEICHAARDLWAPGSNATEPWLLARHIERLRRDHNGGT
jgi:hypothetical protein